MSKTKFILKEDEENKEVEEFTEDTPVEATSAGGDYTYTLTNIN
jgi:hypothetical protein